MLQIFPDTFDAFALDGVADPRLLKLGWCGQGSATGATQMMSQCGADPVVSRSSSLSSIL